MPRACQKFKKRPEQAVAQQLGKRRQRFAGLGGFIHHGWNDGHRYSEVRQHQREDLIAPPTDVARAFVHRPTDHPAHADGEVANVEMKRGGNQPIGDARHDRRHRAEDQRPRKCSVAVLRRQCLRIACADRAGLSPGNTVVVAIQKAPAEGAGIGRRLARRLRPVETQRWRSRTHRVLSESITALWQSLIAGY